MKPPQKNRVRSLWRLFCSLPKLLLRSIPVAWIDTWFMWALGRLDLGVILFSITSLQIIDHMFTYYLVGKQEFLVLTYSLGRSWRDSPWTSWGCWSSPLPQGTPHTGRPPSCIDCYERLFPCKKSKQNADHLPTFVALTLKPIWHTQVLKAVNFDQTRVVRSLHSVPRKSRQGRPQRRVTGLWI